MKEGEEKGALGIPMTSPQEGYTTLEESCGWTTQLLGDKDALDALVLEVPIGGGGTPPAKMA